MSAYILCSRNALRPARRLAEFFGVPFGSTVPSDQRVRTLVRFGSTTGYTSSRLNFREINKLTAVANAVDKLKSLELFETAGLRVPVYSTDWATCGFPCIGRSRRHFGGRGMTLYLQERDLEFKGTSDYYLELIPKKAEYRVHIIGGLSYKMSEKFHPPGCDSYDALRWNHRYGSVFQSLQTPSAELRRSIRQLAKDAVASLNLDFGAVDIIQDEADRLYVLEVNTAPSLNSDSTLQAYAKGFCQHFELGQYLTGRDEISFTITSRPIRGLDDEEVVEEANADGIEGFSIWLNNTRSTERFRTEEGCDCEACVIERQA